VVLPVPNASFLPGFAITAANRKGSMRWLRRTSFVGVLAALVVAAGACNEPLPHGAGATPSPFPRLWPGSTLFAAQAHARRLNVAYFRRFADAGFDAVRIPLVPWWAQRADGSWMWTNYDAMYAWLRERNMTALFVLQNPRTLDDVPAMIDFSRRAAERYPLARLELGNEPDNPGQWPAFYPPRTQSRLTPAAYWAIEKPFAAAWRAGSPDARIATGGTSGIDFEWQRGLVAAIVADGAFADGTVGAIGVHTYGEPLPPRRAQVVADLAAFKAMLPAGIEVWVTEYGLIDPQPADVRGWFATMNALGVPLFSWYEIQDDVLDGQIRRYGLVQLDGTRKAAYDAAREFLRNRP
jgi:hypothetical protein